MKIFRLIISASCMLLPISELYAEEIVVIVNANNKQSIAIQDLKNIYTDRVVKWDDGNDIKVLNLPVETAEREAFSQEVLGVSASIAAAKESNRKITNRIKNPSLTRRASLISSIVARSKNAIAYLPKRMLGNTNHIRIVHHIKD